MTAELHVSLGSEVEDWRQAVRTACRPLVGTGAVSEAYVERCLAMVEEHGPYMVVAPGIALAHARPEDGVNRVCLALARLKSSVPFHHPDNDPVDLVFAFGSPDKTQHLDLLSALAKGLSGDLADRLRAANDDEQARDELESTLNASIWFRT